METSRRWSSELFPDYVLPQAMLWLGHWGRKLNVMVSRPVEESR